MNAEKYSPSETGPRLRKTSTLRAIEQSLVLRVGLTSLDGNLSSTSQVNVMEARSEKFMRDIAGYAFSRFPQHLTDLRRLFNSPKYSDATVLIHDVKLPVHKPVICIQSEYFEKAFQEVFIEGSSNVLTFKVGSGAAHWRVFEYLYTGDYSDGLSSNFEGKQFCRYS